MDPFDYPMPNRKDLMSLSVINQGRDGFKTTTTKMTTMRQTSQNLNTHDIDGALPKKTIPQKPRVQEFQNCTWDIDGAMPKSLHMPLNKPHFANTNDDIEGSHPQIVKFQTKRLGNNPLNPNYQLPKVEEAPLEPPKFIRDTLNIDDIEGSRPKKQRQFKGRDPLCTEDIVGTQRKQFKPRNTPYNNLDYSDITKAKFVTSRSVNPLNPVYHLQSEENVPAGEYGHIEGSTPFVRPQKKAQDHSKALMINDIDGAMADTKRRGAFVQHQRRDVRQLIETGDIEGARAGSLKHAPRTKRVNNPLNPEYDLPGAKSLTKEERVGMYGLSAQEMKDMQEGRRQKTMELAKKEKEGANIKAVSTMDQPEYARNMNYMQKKKDDENFKQNYANFHGVHPVQTFNMEPTNIRNYQRGKQTDGESILHQYGKSILQNPELKKNTKAFFGGGSDPSEGGFEVDKARFFENASVASDTSMLPPAGKPSERLKNFVNETSGEFKRDQRKFFDAAQSTYKSSRPSSRGSSFQRDAANFYNISDAGSRDFKQFPTQTKGGLLEGPTRPNANLLNKPPSILKDPKFDKNKDRFYGTSRSMRSMMSSSSTASKPVSHAQKLDQFIQ